ncbi:tetratricopeptide repeat protein (plasmid) [Streptomyces sp. NBC_00984]|nr:tetratricopeptide repeat protein [Streptomyces sp. NBC_00984]
MGGRCGKCHGSSTPDDLLLHQEAKHRSEAEETCRTTRLDSALAYNHKVRGNVLYRSGRYSEACDVYEQALAEFRDMGERRGEVLARIGLVNSRARLGQVRGQTAADLEELCTEMDSIGLRHARAMVDRAHEELGLTLTAAGGPQ